MTGYGSSLHTDVNNVPTSAELVAGIWQHNEKLVESLVHGAITDITQVTDPAAASATVLQVLRGILSVLVTEDAVAASGAKGFLAMAVRKDTVGADSADGDYAWLQVDPDGRLKVSGTQLEDDPHVSGARGGFMLAIRRDSPTSDAAAGDYHGLHVNALGHLRAITRSEEVDRLNSTSTALEQTRVVKTSAGKLYGGNGYTDLDGFVIIGNKASALSGTSDNFFCVIPVLAGKPFSFDYGAGRVCSTGISIGFSTTGPTWTAGGSRMWVDVQYE